MDKAFVIKWLLDNQVDVRNTGVGLVLFDIVILACTLLFGGVVPFLFYLPRLAIAELLLFVPLVLLVRTIRKESW